MAPLSRGLFLACAGLLSGVTLMGQSRGWLVAIPFAVLIFVVSSRHWRRSLVAVLAVAAGTAAVSSALLAVHDEFDSATIGDLASEAALGILVVAALLGARGHAGRGGRAPAQARRRDSSASAASASWGRR